MPKFYAATLTYHEHAQEEDHHSPVLIEWTDENSCLLLADSTHTEQQIHAAMKTDADWDWLVESDTDFIFHITPHAEIPTAEQLCGFRLAQPYSLII